jgi:hypothetical protein
MRILVLVLAALGILVEAVVFGGLLYILGEVIGAYSMSMGNMSAEHGRLAVWILGGVLGGGLVLLAMWLVVTAVRGHPFGRGTRAVVVTALVVQGILGLVVLLMGSAKGLIGVLVVFALLLFALVKEPTPERIGPQHTAAGAPH